MRNFALDNEFIICSAREATNKGVSESFVFDVASGSVAIQILFYEGYRLSIATVLAKQIGDVNLPIKQDQSINSTMHRLF